VTDKDTNRIEKITKIGIEGNKKVKEMHDENGDKDEEKENVFSEKTES
jgi:hypothetical protein